VHSVIVYTSGHGFGHASRDIEVINAVGARAPGTRIIVRTSAPRWLFDLSVRVPHELAPGETDTGIVQRDSLSHDIGETVRRTAAFYASFDRRASDEAQFLREAGAAAVIADIPPLAFEAARRAGVPCFALGNFTWDWIYAGYPELAPGLVERIAEAYSSAAEAWRLPMHGGFESCRTVIDVPFIARHSTRDPRDTRAAFGLPPDRRVVLSSFGGYGLGGLPLDALDCLDRYAVVTTETSAGPAPRSTHPMVFSLQEHDIYRNGWRYEDLVRAADIVITKPGFGIIAECLANDTALVYTSRGRFAEYGVLVAEMPTFLRCAFIEQSDLLAGRWAVALDTALAKPKPPTHPATNGADVVASRLTTVLNSPQSALRSQRD
jgi:L-arabinokinase